MDEFWMWRAIELAANGRGFVEPNPLVGCVLVKNGESVGEGWHQEYGGPHAEVHALQAAGENARGATAYVTLEPCCHFGKTPPCADALIHAGVKRVVVGMTDPFPQVAGGGIEKLRKAGIQVDVGVLKTKTERLNHPYMKLLFSGRPYITAKWAMTLDGKIASRTYSSRWISNRRSRAAAHLLRGRMDGVLVGAGTVVHDNPMMSVRYEDFPEEIHPNKMYPQRVPLRVVADTHLRTPLDSLLVQTAKRFPVLILVGPEVSDRAVMPYLAAGCEIFRTLKTEHSEQLGDLLDELGRRRLTNLLVEGGGRVLGTLWDMHQIDEIDVFIAPKLVGGVDAVSPLGGLGIAAMEQAAELDDVKMEILDGDLHWTARVVRNDSNNQYGDWITDA
ncbi:MAG: bifunctional diaminohydroxyphosphoribosylaminopyrimidine deaminase/5-amino-6-(5-phosphoribosylamino)uracil reductase RibD [Planctomycetia bacterium]|nr:bifunctional diaminohydroxyphosphoribosylaminopyrimidine deaminase/5-amino-6-(5-phosphoribosylamino)uracil reductase RibD [Planctomycetia bacterium]